VWLTKFDSLNFLLSWCGVYSGPRRALVARSPSEKRHVEETVASIRLRARYHDPYEEWEKQTRRDAFVRIII